jgi:4-alpha-glucanotransferase
MKELLERFESYCKMSGIELDAILKTFDEPQQVDNMDVNDKQNAKMQILKNVFKNFLQAEGQNISDEHLEFIMKVSNLI